MTKIQAGAAALGLVVGLTAKSARAQIENIGQAGQIVFGAERLTGVYHDEMTVTREATSQSVDPTTGQVITTTRTVDDEVATTSFGIFGSNVETPVGLIPTSDAGLPRLALDYLPIDGLSIGGSFMYLTRSGKETVGGVENPDSASVHSLILYPRVGYAYPFNETIGIWPRAGVIYEQDVQTRTSPTVERTTTVHFINLALEAMLYISPMKHFAILVGPYGEIGLGGGTKSESDAPGSTTTKRDAKMNSFGGTVGVVGYY